MARKRPGWLGLFMGLVVLLLLAPLQPGLAASIGIVWLGNDTHGDVFATDTDGNVLHTVPGVDVTGIAFDGSSLYFSDRASKGFATGGLGYDPVTDSLWVGDNTVVRNMSLGGVVLDSFASRSSAALSTGWSSFPPPLPSRARSVFCFWPPQASCSRAERGTLRTDRNAACT